MASASKTLNLDIPRDALWKVILDYEKYPEFVEGCQKVKILSRETGKVRVEYSISLMGKDIFYVLDHIEAMPGKMSWTLVESNIMKVNTGGWELVESNGSTAVTYSLELDFKIYVPGMILNGLVKSQLPKMIEGFGKRAVKNG